MSKQLVERDVYVVYRASEEKEKSNYHLWMKRQSGFLYLLWMEGCTFA